MPPPSGRARLLAVLRWAAGSQGYYDAPDSKDRRRILEKAWVVEAGGFLELTDEGRQLLEELVAGAESTEALRLALTTSASYRDAKRVLELCGDYATALAWIVARQVDGRPMVPEEPTE